MNKIQELKQKIAECESQIKELQDTCSHPPLALEYRHCSNTGNYLEADEYWTDFHCTLCEKRWSEDGSVRVPDGATKLEGKKF